MDNPRILIIQAAGEHAANANFREGLSLMRAFDRLDVESMIWGKGYSNFTTPLTELAKQYDVLFVVENYGMEWIPNLKALPNIKIFWSIDGHMIVDQHQKWTKDNGIDLVLNSCVEYVGAFPHAKESIWFPNCVDETLVYPVPGIVKKYAVGFCGNINNRQPLLDMLRVFGIKQDIFVIGDAMREALNSYMVGWNFNIKNDINYRTFEVTAAQSMLMTNRTDGISMLFDEDKEIILYDGREDMMKKIEYFITHPQEAKKIAVAGYQKTINNHTYFHRAKIIVDILKANAELVNKKTNETGQPINNDAKTNTGIKQEYPTRVVEPNTIIPPQKKPSSWQAAKTAPKYKPGGDRNLGSVKVAETVEKPVTVDPAKTEEQIITGNNKPVSFDDYFKTNVNK